MTLRFVLLAATTVALGAAFARSMSARTVSPGAAPAAADVPAPAAPAAPASGPAATAAAAPGSHADLLSDGAPALSALEAGMPRDRHSDADDVRPGFADYARGA